MSNINQILAALADEISAIAQKSSPDAKDIARKLPHRSLSGDHISGGTIQNFASAGIQDLAKKTQLFIDDAGVRIKNLKAENIDDLTVNGTLKTKVLEVDEIRADIKFEKDTPIVFSGDQLEGKGLLWSGKGNTKQFIFATNPDRFFSSEHIDLAKGKSITANGIQLFNENELGPTVVKSNLQELGRLRGLIVDGDVIISQYLIFNSETNRLGLGTEEPNAALAIAEDGIEVLVGTKDFNKGFIGTYASHQFDIVTDNQTRLSIAASGNINLGNTKLPPVQVAVHGKLSIKVNTPDPEVDLHIAGPVKFNNRLQKVDRTYPTAGTYNAGDIVWNSEPKLNQYVGWICVQTGSPGIWEPFGKIGNS